MGADDFHVSVEHMDKIEKRRDLQKDLDFANEKINMVKDDLRIMIDCANKQRERAILSEAKLAALTQVHEQFADNAVEESLSLMERLKQAEEKLSEHETWTDAVCNTNNKLSMLNKELVDALQEAKIHAMIGKPLETLDARKVDKWVKLIAKAKEDTK